VTRRPPKDFAASVRQRLLDRSRKRGEDFNLTLTRYAIERFLFRLSKSAYAGQFVLKGGMLFPLWAGDTYRPTRDLDVLAAGERSSEWLEEVVRAVCRVDGRADGIKFDPDSVRVEENLGNQQYPGLTACVGARLGNARIRLRIDVGYGDAVTPEPVEQTYPTLLADLPAPKVKMYPPETVVAEKLEATVRFGPVFSRMKDLYDLWAISRRFAFRGPVLGEAVQATFTRRRAEIPDRPPYPLTEAFAARVEAARRWGGFLEAHGLAGKAPALEAVVTQLRTFLLPLLEAVRTGKASGRWPQGGPWSE